MKWAWLTAALFVTQVGLAQTRQTYPYKTVEYIAADNHVLPGPEGADHRTERIFRDSLTGSVRIYDAAGRIKEITPYGDMVRRITLGPRTTYYDSGATHTKVDLVANKRQGEFVVYYPDGKVKRRETYEADERKTAECYAPDGSVAPYYPYEVMPTYKGGGLEKMVRAVQANVRYPAEALRNGIEGRVFVSFRVSASGAVEDVKVVKGLGAALDAETIAGVKKLSGFTPGTRDGEPVAVTFTIPITYKITQAPPTFHNRDQGFGNPSQGFPR